MGRQFLQKYHDKIVMWNGDVNTFKDFVSPLLTILEKNFEMDTSQSIIPTKQLDTISLFNLEKDLKETAAMAFDKLRNSTHGDALEGFWRATA